MRLILQISSVQTVILSIYVSCNHEPLRFCRGFLYSDKKHRYNDKKHLYISQEHIIMYLLNFYKLYNI